MGKDQAVAAMQAVSPIFPVGVYGSPWLFLAKLFMNLIVPMIFVAVIVSIAHRLKRTGIDLANADCVLRLKVACLMFMGILVNVPTAATYIAWNDPQVPDWMMAHLLTASVICDVLRLPFVIAFIFVGFHLKVSLSRSWAARALRWTLRSAGRSDLAERFELKPSTQAIRAVGGSRQLDDGSIISIPSVAVPALVWVSLLAITITIAKLYRIA